ncbi:MAG: hypothetical protein AB1716_10870 [Planctomycetota bacterium]
MNEANGIWRCARVALQCLNPLLTAALSVVVDDGWQARLAERRST